MGRLLRGNFLSRGRRRLRRSKQMESQSATDVFIVSDVFHQDDVRSLARGHLVRACSHERGGVRVDWTHLGVCMVGLLSTTINLASEPSVASHRPIIPQKSNCPKPEQTT